MYKAIIFDFFDVVHADPFLAWLRKYGYKKDGEFEENSRLVDLGQISEHQFYERLSELSSQPVSAIKEEFSMARTLDHDLLTLIDRLHGTYKTGLLSNSSSEYIRPILSRHGIMSIFDKVVISAEVKMVKPAPEIFELILKKLAVQPHQAIFVDDDARNTETASSLGIRSILYKDRQTLHEDLKSLGVSV